jgi:hypothetical protein
MPKTERSRASRFVIAGPLALALLATLMVAPVVSAGESAPITLASASDGRTLKLGDVASDDNLVGVVFQEKNRSYLRWSENYGQSFESKVALRKGKRATEPRVAVCDDLIFAVSLWQTAVAREVGVDYRNVVTGDKGKFSLGQGYLADIACFGEVVAVTWVQSDHLWLAVHEGPCANPCSPAVKLDLGTGDFDNPPRITSDSDGLTATWITTGLAVQHFGYSPGGAGGFTIVAGPVLTLMAGKDVRVPVIAGLGPRVVVAYKHNGQTHARISDDMGASFGPRIIVSMFCRNCPEGASQPDSVAVRGSNILVEVLRAGGIPPAYEAVAFVSRNSGDSWEERSTHNGGFQRGVLLTSATFAEAWDAHFYNGFPYPDTEQLIGFQVQSL